MKRTWRVLLLAVAFLGLRVREQHDPVGGECRERVADCVEGVALACVAGGRDA